MAMHREDLQVPKAKAVQRAPSRGIQPEFRCATCSLAHGLY